MSNKVLITNDQNVVKIPSGLRILIRRSCNAVLDFEKFDGPAEISVTFVDNNRIHELNNEYRHKDSATDVLSFPLGAGLRPRGRRTGGCAYARERGSCADSAGPAAHRFLHQR